MQQLKNRKSTLTLALLFGVTVLFEFLPAVKEARTFFSDNAYLEGNCNCLCILKNRPWYGQVNHWIWFWLLSTPIIIFSVTPNSPVLQRGGRTIFTLILSYTAINLAMPLALELNNGPFLTHGIVTSSSSTKEKFIAACFSTGGDGAAIPMFGFLYGIFFSILYTGWWEIIWHQYHKRKTKLITDTFKRDWANRFIIYSTLLLSGIYLLAWVVKIIRHIFTV